jgi:ribosome maturation factor RimP
LQNQRTWKGILHVDEAQQLSLQVEQKPGEWISIEFTIDEVEKANLVPVLNFKGVN